MSFRHLGIPKRRPRKDDFAEKVLSALRFQFGGHEEKSADSKAGA
jgi:6-phosphogluconate dehydrogenase (decarboxylating)